MLKKLVVQGFPEKSKSVHSSIREYWNFRDEISLENGLILKGERVIIPESMRSEFTTKIHEGHQGITRCQQRAKATVFWPGINEDIQRAVESCRQCQTYQASQKKEPTEEVEYPKVPWHTLGTDLFHLENKTYLIVCDYYSKYPIVQKLTDLSSNSIAQCTSNIISMFGIPSEIITDNGPQFIGKPYQDLMKKLDIIHTTSSPHHARSHGFIERQIRTVKGMIRKSPHENDMAMLALRTTPIGINMPSPAELLFQRRIGNNLPVHNGNQNNVITKEQTAKAPRENTLAREKTELHLDQLIFHQDVAKKTWTPGVVVGVGPEPRSYTIRCTITGRYLRRNRELIRPRKVSFEDDQVAELDESFMNEPVPNVPGQDKAGPDKNNSANDTQRHEVYRDVRPRRPVQAPRRLITEI